MQSKPRLRKSYLATLIALLLAATVLLTVSIQSIEFNPARGRPPAYSLFEGESEPLAEPLPFVGETGGAIDTPAPEISLFAALFFGGGLIIVLLTREGRQRMFYAILRGAIFGLALYLLAPRMSEILSDIFGGFGQGADATETAVAPPMPAVFQVLVSLPVAILFTFVGWRLYQRFRPKPTRTKGNFMLEVQNTIDQLDAGNDLQDSILSCYRAMITQARHERLISTDQTATTLELEQKLIGYGLPQRETERLTRLFEEVRYGVHQASQRERLEARDCLVAFINACETKFGRPQPQSS